MRSCTNSCQVGLILWERPFRGLCSSRNHISRHSPNSNPRPEQSQPAASTEAKPFPSTLRKLVNRKRDYTSSRSWPKDQGGQFLQEQREGQELCRALRTCGASASHSVALVGALSPSEGTPTTDSRGKHAGRMNYSRKELSGLTLLAERKLYGTSKELHPF